MNDTYDAYELCLIKLHDNASQWAAEDRGSHMMRALFLTLITELLRQEQRRIDTFFHKG